MNHILGKLTFLLGFGAIVTTGLMLAEPVDAEGDEGAPEDTQTSQEAENACVAAAKSCNWKDIGSSFGTMRNSCKEFRSCKNSCGNEKRECKGAARMTKRDCKASCQGKKGKAKRQCKKACRQAKRSEAQSCRQARRACNQTCRATLLDNQCRSARKKFWSTLAKEGGKCAKKLVNSCEDVFPKQ